MGPQAVASPAVSDSAAVTPPLTRPRKAKPKSAKPAKHKSAEDWLVPSDGLGADVRCRRLIAQVGGMALGKTGWYSLGARHVVRPLATGGVEIYRSWSLANIQAVKVDKRRFVNSSMRQVIFEAPDINRGLHYHRKSEHFMSFCGANNQKPETSLAASLQSAGFDKNSDGLYTHSGMPDVRIFACEDNKLVVMRRIDLPMLKGWQAPLTAVAEITGPDGRKCTQMRMLDQENLAMSVTLDTSPASHGSDALGAGILSYSLNVNTPWLGKSTWLLRRYPELGAHMVTTLAQCKRAFSKY